MITSDSNPLQEERDKCSFDITKLQHILYNGADKFKIIKQARE